MTQYRFSTDITQVDWKALKAALVEDKFDNLRTPEQYKLSAENSFLNVFVYDGARIIGNGRVLSYQVCNAYVVDIWTHSSYRRQGIAKEIMRILTEACPGQHVYLFTDDSQAFYERCGFKPQDTGMGMVVGRWLNLPRSPCDILGT